MNAASVLIEYNNIFSTESINEPTGGTPWLTAIIDDENTAGSVLITINTGAWTGSEYLSGTYFNIADYDSSVTSVSYVSGVVAEGTKYGSNTASADGSGYYDVSCRR